MYFGKRQRKKNPERFFFSLENPDFLLDDDANKVDNPHEKRAGNDAKDTYHKVDDRLVRYTVNNTVNCPYNVKSGDAENELYDPRKIIHCLEQIFHEAASYNINISFPEAMFIISGNQPINAPNGIHTIPKRTFFGVFWQIR